MHRIVIESDGTGSGTKLFVDGEEITQTHLIQGLEFRCEANGPANLTTRELLVRRVDPETGEKLVKVEGGKPTKVRRLYPEEAVARPN